ncbi:MAG: HAMP domain-containing histidine kinase [Proteobacteria bacterium]|nr:HAMP domain-containing histidine kinase [Pseudomonadota bacterium]
MTVKKRIILLVACAGFITSLLFSIIVFCELIEQPFVLLDKELKEEAYRTVKIITKGQRESALPAYNSPGYEDYPYWLKIYERDSNKLLYESNLAKIVKLPLLKPRSKSIVSVIIPPKLVFPGQHKNTEITFRIRSIDLTYTGRDYTVQIARTMLKLKDEIWELVFGLIAGLIFSSMALIVISYFIAGKILKPIASMRDLTHNISDKNLDQRIPVGAENDEFNELAGTINRMLDRLEYSFVKQKNLLFDTSHEMKTPLSTMRLAIDDICSADIENLPPFLRENLLRLKNQVLRMERLVKDLLNLSSLEVLDSIKQEPLDLTDLLSSLAEDYRFLADAQNIRMDLNLQDKLIINGDADKLNRTFSNIFDNAIKYNIKGGQISVESTRSSDGIKTTVTNTGSGLAENETNKIFEHFYRIEKSRSIQHGGSGLGLAIAKRIIELHGGSIKMESVQGKWARVIVYLPYAYN